MKEELKIIKANIEELATIKKEFDKKRKFFNLKVEEVLEQSEIKEFASEAAVDSYSRACIFYEYAEKLIDIIEGVREEHPKYGETRIREVSRKAYLGENSNSGKIFEVERMLDNYFMYDNCGYKKVKNIEEKLNQLTTDITTRVNNEFENVGNLACSTLENPEQLLGTVKKKTKTFVKKTVKKTLRSILIDEDDD